MSDPNDLIRRGDALREIMLGRTVTGTERAIAALPAVCSWPALTGDRETDFDNGAVYQFARLMRDKMEKSRAKGKSGWNDPVQCRPNYLRTLLYEHIYKGDPVDVANLCMMLHHYDEPTTPSPVNGPRLPLPAVTDPQIAKLQAERARLVEAVEALGAIPEGYCFCSKGRIGDDSKTHEPECADIRAILKEMQNDRV